MDEMVQISIERYDELKKKERLYDEGKIVVYSRVLIGEWTKDLEVDNENLDANEAIQALLHDKWLANDKVQTLKNELKAKEAELAYWHERLKLEEK